MNWTRKMALGLSCLVLGLASSCATDPQEDENPELRRAEVAEQDAESLRQTIADLTAVEKELSADLRRVRGQRDQSQEEVNRLNGELASLRKQLADKNSALTNVSMNEKSGGTRATPEIQGLAGKNTTVIEGDGDLTLRMSGGLFQSGSDQLTPDGKKILNRVAPILRRRSDLDISVEGHTDAQPLGKSRDVWVTNLGLSLARAMSVYDYLRAKKVPASRMKVAGWGEHRPVVAGKSAKAYAANRRVELVLRPRD